MIRLDLLFFGYFKVTVDKEDIKTAVNILVGRGVSAKIDKSGSFLIVYRKREYIEKIFEGKIRYSVSEPKGLVGFFIKHKSRYGIFVGIFLMSLVFLISSDTVWDVRIEGDITGDEAQILEELSSAGLAIGKRWSKIDRGEIEISALSDSDNIAWINVNRRGSVAYVSIGRKSIPGREEKPSGYASIVAKRDCVIEDITVSQGYPMVKKGESVRAGQVLISGVIPEELGGGFCYASGTVIGRYTDRVSVSADRNVIEKISDEPILDTVSILFFGKELNIFKKYRQSDTECDIIEKTEEITLGKPLPISVRKIYRQSYQTDLITLCDDQLIASCSDKFRKELNAFLSDKEAKRLSVSAEFVDGGYRMVCDMVVCTEVAKIQEFKVE